MRINPGSTDESLYFKLVDPTTGAPETGLTLTSLTVNYVRERAVRVGASATALAAATTAHTDNGMFEVDSTNCPGLYRADFPDAAFASGVDRVQCIINGAAIDPAVIEVELNYNLGSAADMATAVHDEVIENSKTFREMIRIMKSAVAGDSTGGGKTFRDDADTKNRIVATTDGSNNRTITSLDGS